MLARRSAIHILRAEKGSTLFCYNNYVYALQGNSEVVRRGTSSEAEKFRLFRNSLWRLKYAAYLACTLEQAASLASLF